MTSIHWHDKLQVTLTFKLWRQYTDTTSYMLRQRLSYDDNILTRQATSNIYKRSSYIHNMLLESYDLTEI